MLTTKTHSSPAERGWGWGWGGPGGSLDPSTLLETHDEHRPTGPTVPSPVDLRPGVLTDVVGRPESVDGPVSDVGPPPPVTAVPLTPEPDDAVEVPRSLGRRGPVLPRPGAPPPPRLPGFLQQRRPKLGHGTTRVDPPPSARKVWTDQDTQGCKDDLVDSLLWSRRSFEVPPTGGESGVDLGPLGPTPETRLHVIQIRDPESCSHGNTTGGVMK